jgi:hypothetical protein
MASAVPPNRFIFDAVDDLSQARDLGEKWTGSIKFRCLPVYQVMVGSPLDKTSIEELDICDYLNSGRPLIARLYLDPEKYNPPVNYEESIATNQNWLLLKASLEEAAHTSGSPIMSNGGTKGTRIFKCKLRNRVYRAPPGSKKEGAPQQDDFIDMDKGGRRAKRTRGTTQALSPTEICTFQFSVKWDFYGFYIALANSGGCPCHLNHTREEIALLLPIRAVIQSGDAGERSAINDASSLNECLNVDDLSLPEMASARDILKPQINEILQCLDTLKSKTSIDKATKVLNDLANELRLELPQRRVQN